MLLFKQVVKPVLKLLFKMQFNSITNISLKQTWPFSVRRASSACGVSQGFGVAYKGLHLTFLDAAWLFIVRRASGCGVVHRAPLSFMVRLDFLGCGLIFNGAAGLS